MCDRWPSSHSLCLAATCLALLGLPHGEARAATRKPPTGLIVEELGKGSAAEKAGLQPADLLLSWSREGGLATNGRPAEGAIESPFDLITVELEQAPQGLVTLKGRRGGSVTEWKVPPGPWRLEALPPLPSAVRAKVQEARGRLEAGRPEDALARWREAAGAMSRPCDRAWLLLAAGKALAAASAVAPSESAFDEAFAASAGSLAEWWLAWESGEARRRRNAWDGAVDRYRRALDAARSVAPEGLATAVVLSGMGGVEYARGNLAAAEDNYGRALAIRERLAPSSLSVAASLTNLGNVAHDQGHMDPAGEYFRRALAINEMLVPGSLAVAGCLNNLGSLARTRGDLQAAQDYYRKALGIREDIAPQSLDVAGSLANLGMTALDRGDLPAAEEYSRRALAILERIAPGSLDVAKGLNNLGTILLDRGDMAAAEEVQRRSLAIRERLVPGSLAVSHTLNNLGVIAHDRGDADAAVDYHRRALAIREKLAPESAFVATSLLNLGTAAEEQGDLEGAEEYHRRSLAIKEKLAPDSLAVAHSLHNLGVVAELRADLGAAEESYRKALAIRERLAPDGLDVATSLNSLGVVALDRRDLDAAQKHIARALSIRERLAPGTVAEADSRHQLGRTHREAGSLDLAARFLCDAVDSLEQQEVKLGGNEETRSGFAARYASIYHDCASVLHELGRPSQAFHILERSRARSLLAMLAERDLLFTADLSPEAEHARRLLSAEYDRTQAALDRLSPVKDGQKIEGLLVSLRELRTKLEEVAKQIKHSSPRLASLQYPEPLDVGEVRAILDPGTALLAYSVGPDETLLFVVRAGGEDPLEGLKIWRLPVTEDALRANVEAFRSAVESPARQDAEAMTRQSRELHALLIEPAEDWIASSARLLVSPDGPLHTLPFGALMRRAVAGKVVASSSRYLVEWKPLHVVISATVYAELRRARRDADASATTLVAFGDPRYPALGTHGSDEAASRELRSAVRGGLRFTSLPASRAEVEQITGLYPGRARAFLGEEATEEKAKAIGRDVRFVHFATHAYVNERLPLNSALVLSLPDKVEEGHDNGLLQAWEIFEKVRIDADLVTLSACETGLGKEMGGEGLVGLTRAFQYAGARSILASLWNVSDESTADLMRRFYTYLKQGKAKDEALRAAQLDLIHGATAANPFHWAAFQLVGDWR